MSVSSHLVVLTDFSDHEHAIDDLAEDDMLPVQKVTLGRRQEELAPVRVLQRGGRMGAPLQG